MHDYLRATVLNNKFLAKLLGKESFGLNNLDLKLSTIMNLENGFYIELGANDGISQSNTKMLELFKGWHGILIEPSPKKFKSLRKNRSRENCFFNCACVSFQYKKNTIDLIYSNLMTVALDGENDLPSRLEHAGLGKQFLNYDQIETFTSEARTLQSIIDEAGAPAVIDFLSLDVEGGEIEVLKGIDFEKNKFRYLLIETRSIEKVTRFLESKNMILDSQLSHHDYFFKALA